MSMQANQLIKSINQKKFPVAQVATDAARTTKKSYWGKGQGRKYKTSEV